MNADAIAFGLFARAGIGTHVETNDDRFGCNGQVDVGLADTTHCCVNQLNFDLVGRQFEQGGRQSFLRTLNVCFDDDGQCFDFASAHVAEHVFQLGGLLLGQLGVAELASAVSGNFTGTTFVAQHHEFITRLGYFRQTLNFNGDRRTSRFDRLAIFIQHGTNTAKCLTCQDHITG